MSRIEYISLAGLRVDGRRPNEARRVQCRLGVLPHVDGSAYIEQGNTKVLAIVLGPKETSRRGDSRHDRATIKTELNMAPFAGTERKKRGPGDRKHIEMALAVKRVFEETVQTDLYPQSNIEIHIQVLQADGGSLCAAINATTLALLDAGIAMKEFVVACGAGLLDKVPVLDLNYIETGANGPEVPIAYLPTSRKVVLASLNCRLPYTSYGPVMQLAIEGCKQVYEILKRSVREYTVKKLNVRGLVDVK